jgi:hypothetical protein
VSSVTFLSNMLALLFSVPLPKIGTSCVEKFTTKKLRTLSITLDTTGVLRVLSLE